MKMKLLALILLTGLVVITKAQLAVDSNYTILAKGANDEKTILPFLYADFSRLEIKENNSGKICSPTSLHFTFVINQETFYADNAKAAQLLVSRTKPKDKIFIDKIILGNHCFLPPKQIVITVM